VVKGRTRQIARFLKAEGRLPADVFELEGEPRVARMLLPAACDAQQATLARDAVNPRAALLRLQLPNRPDPRSYRDWSWVAIPPAVPVTVPDAGALHPPTLRIAGGQVYADLAFSHAAPKAARVHRAHGRARGRLGAEHAPVRGRGPPRRPGAAPHARLRRAVPGGGLHAKADHYHRLADGQARLQKTPDDTLAARHAGLVQEVARVSARRSHLNNALAASAARWTVDQAIAAGATVIYAGDLRSMEAKGMGRSLNTRLSQQVRGAITDRMRHLAAEAGIAVVTVPAANTSRHCPRCLVPLRHCAAPDRPTRTGWTWVLCPNPGCGWQGDRDHGARQRIAARGLTHQATTFTDRTGGRMAVAAVVDRLEAAAVITDGPNTSASDRSKTGPTRRQTPRSAPRRRGAPSPERPPGRTGQRPERTATTDRQLPRAATRNQGGHDTIGTRARHRPRGAALGAGFHLHAHATPPRWQYSSAATDH
jgi:hypothetical protein